MHKYRVTVKERDITTGEEELTTYERQCDRMREALVHINLSAYTKGAVVESVVSVFRTEADSWR